MPTRNVTLRHSEVNEESTNYCRKLKAVFCIRSKHANSGQLILSLFWLCSIKLLFKLHGAESRLMTEEFLSLIKSNYLLYKIVNRV